jgi:selenide,water dikinase
LRGGAEKAREAGVVIVGGHTIQDKEPKYGLVALGFAHPQKMMTKGGLKPGDALFLSKPIGTGVIATAIKAGSEKPEEAQEAIDWMLRLNRQTAELALGCGAAAATDITGFSLLGHAWEMASASGVGMRIELEKVPFMKGAHRLAENWVFPGGAYDNAEFFGPHVGFQADIPQEMQLLLFDPQTSGGLLFGVGPERAAYVNEKSSKMGLDVWRIGEVTESNKIEIA